MAKDILFNIESRDGLKKGVDALSNAVKVTLGPKGRNVVIEPAAAEQKTASGIIIPDTAKEKPQQGKVVAVGPGTKDNAMTLKVGDNVIYGKYAGTEFHLDGKDYMIMRESDVIAII